MMLAAPLAGYLALPALAGLLMMTAWHMSEPHKWRERMAGRPSDRVLLLLTMFLTVFSDLTVAIGVGTALGLALRLRRREARKSVVSGKSVSVSVDLGGRRIIKKKKTEDD